MPAVRLRTAPEKARPAASPGLLPYHYAPHTPLRLFGPGPAALSPFRCGHHERAHATRTVARPARPGRGDLAEAAHGLCAALHHLDALGLRLLLAERLPETRLGLALNERLEKAAARK